MDNVDLTIQKLKDLFQEIESYCFSHTRLPHEPHQDVFEIVAQSSDPRITKFLIETVQQSSDSSVRTTAIEALGRIRAESTTEILLAILKKADEDKDVRSEAALALGRIGVTTVVPTLIETLRNKRNGRMVMWHCADALYIGHFNDPLVVDALIDALTDDYTGIKDSSDITEAARDALVAIGDDYTVGRLIEKLAAKPLSPIPYMDDAIRQDIIIAVGHIQNPLSLSPLLQILSDSNRTDLQEAAIEALANFDDPRATSAIRAALDSSERNNIRRISSL